MFADHSFCEQPFSSFTAIVLNGEIFYFEGTINNILQFDSNLSRSATFQLKIDKTKEFTLDIESTLDLEE